MTAKQGKDKSPSTYTQFRDTLDRKCLLFQRKLNLVMVFSCAFLYFYGLFKLGMIN
jgi:hypothetical protein